LEDFNETWYKERSQYCKGNPVQFLQGVMAAGLNIFFEKYFVIATHPLEDFDETWYIERYNV
jgi:hypothetical protein